MTLTWINRRSDPILELQLAEGGEILESLQLNPIQESVRIRCDGYHQVFFLDNSKAWQDQVVFTNAYGFETGMIKFERYPLLSGTLSLEDQKFRISQHGASNTITVYRDASRETGVTVDLPVEDNLPQHSIPVANKRLEMDATILLGICWNLMKTVETVEVSGSERQVSWMR